MLQSDVHACTAGQTQCLLFRRHYQEYQCATCLTNAYIRLKSGDRHQCRNRAATYCWYQCQLELFGNDKGVVNEKCRCKAGESPSSSKTPLPSSCYSPTGSDCKWYQDCLERRFPCAGTSAHYTVKYATHFCSAYNRSYDQLTPLGRVWVDAVRKCLQVSLAPFLRECISNITCEFIQDRAVKSHDCCYLGGTECTPKGVPSICDVSVKDWFTVFIPINDAFFQPEAKETFRSVLDVGLNCFRNYTSITYQKLKEAMSGWLRSIQLEFQYLIGRNLLQKQLSDNDQFQQNSRFAVVMIDQVSKQLKWDKTKLSWFAFSTNITNNKLANTNPDYFSVNVILVDKQAKASGIRNSTLLNNTFAEFVDNIRECNITQIENIVLKTAFDCQDILCSNVTEYKANSASATFTTKIYIKIWFFFSLITFPNVHF